MLEGSTPAHHATIAPDFGSSRRPRDRATGRLQRDPRLNSMAMPSLTDAARADVSYSVTVPTIIPRQRSEWASRAVNFTLALLSIVLLTPLLLLVALVVMLTSRGPVIYVQERVGIDRRARPTVAMYDRRGANTGGKVFRIYKFRTMRADAEQRSGAVWATRNDPRVTVVGTFLRRSRLDELPQLVNVLLGDMNIVGPRPERPSIFRDLRESIADYSLRQRTKPGITGLAQINHSYDSSIDDVRIKVSYDLEYIEQQSIWEDMRIMLKTIPVMLFKKGGW